MRAVLGNSTYDCGTAVAPVRSVVAAVVEAWDADLSANEEGGGEEGGEDVEGLHVG